MAKKTAAPAFHRPKIAPMTHRRALRTALAALADIQKYYNFGANVYERSGFRGTFAKDWKERARCREAARVLRLMLEEESNHA